ncbi:MAG: hypothetical protein NC223_05575 [Butyrivibrio sp.]|nr:hypothetical protein [Butyrivibrio sp.]
MTREEADAEAKKIISESNRKEDEIIAKAKADGTWVSGLDTNRELFEPIKKETWEKLQKLAAMIDE